MRLLILTETIALIGNGDLEVNVRQAGVMDIRLMSQTRGHALAQVKQIEGGGETGIATAGNKDFDGGRRCGHGGHGGYVTRKTTL